MLRCLRGPAARGARAQRSSTPAAAFASAASLSRPSTERLRTGGSSSSSPSPPPPRRGLVEYWAACAPGLESVVAAELASPLVRALGVAPGRAGVRFEGDESTGLRAVLWLRAATRVLRKLGDTAPLRPSAGPYGGGDALYAFVREAVPSWPELLPRGASFSVAARVWSCPGVPSDRLAATRAKDAICDALRAAGRAKPEPPGPGHPTGGDTSLVVVAFEGAATLFRDLAGASLHRRGYRRGLPLHAAALAETTAAGALMLAGAPGSPPGLAAASAAGSAGSWPGVSVDVDGERSLVVDPMCGSGTILIEAALMAGCVAPGLLARPTAAGWPCLRWPDAGGGGGAAAAAALWRAAAGEAAEAGARARAQRPRPPAFAGADASGRSVALAAACARAAGVGHLVTFREAAVQSDWDPAAGGRGGGGGGGGRVTHVVSNPPWGGRLQSGAAGPRVEGKEGDDGSEGGEWEARAEGGSDDRPGGDGGEGEGTGGASVEETWFQLGAWLRRRCAGAAAGLLCANKAAAAKLFVGGGRRHPVTVGGVDARLLLFKLLPPKGGRGEGPG